MERGDRQHEEGDDNPVTVLLEEAKELYHCRESDRGEDEGDSHPGNMIGQRQRESPDQVRKERRMDQVELIVEEGMTGKGSGQGQVLCLVQRDEIIWGRDKDPDQEKQDKGYKQQPASRFHISGHHTFCFVKIIIHI